MVGKTVFVVSFFVATWAFGQDATAENPFRTPPPTPASGPVVPEDAVTSLDGFEFNGIMKLGGVLRISVFDSKTKKNFWLTEGELGEMGLSFQRFNDENESVVIVQGGVTKSLSLNKVKIEALKITSPPVSPVAVSTPSVTSRPQGPAEVESDEEARKRIQRVAEEIRRRRAERRKRLEERSTAGGR